MDKITQSLLLRSYFRFVLIFSCSIDIKFLLPSLKKLLNLRLFFAVNHKLTLPTNIILLEEIFFKSKITECAKTQTTQI